MKKVFLVMAILSALPFLGKAQTINWITFQEAVKLNETAPKKIFIDVYTDWCGWCKKMDQTTFKSPEVVAYMNANYYAVKLNAEMNDTIDFAGYTFINEGGQNGRKGTHQLAAALLQGKLSYPSYVFMDENDQLITPISGYMEADDFLPVLMYFGSDSYLEQSFKDYVK